MAKRHEKVTNLVNSMLDAEKNFWDLFLDFVPQEAKKHLKAARKEKLMALRSILDAKIEHLEEDEKKASKKGPQKVKVQ
jgi:hypothetical protein